MACHIEHDVPHELADLPPSPELHALAMPRAARGEIDEVLLDCRRLPGMRMLRVYMPSPAFRGAEPLPMLLVNDGHKAFESARHRSVAPWQQSGTMQLHRVMDGMLCAGLIKPAAVVAIATHASSRADHYVPIRSRHGETDFGGQGDIYLDLIEHEVLPAVQSRFGAIAWSQRANDRVLVGASIGGLSALYGAMTRPSVFGAAVALSPSAWVEDGFLTRLAQRDYAGNARIAADVGEHEQAPIREHCAQLFTAMSDRGGDQVLAVEVPGLHNEDSWRQRLPRLLRHVIGAGL